MPEMLYTIIIYPITQIIEVAFVLAQKLFKETGISIIFISLTISILCLPLYAIAEKWQQIERDIEKKLKPKIDKIKQTFSGDEQYMILSTYYRQNNYHPIYALRGTFGLLIQIPFFIAAYTYLSHLEVLKGIGFFFIKDLGVPDAAFSVGNFAINILPILMTLINCLAGAIYTRSLPVKDKMQVYGTALVFLLLLYKSPSALVLYWTMNNIFSLIKNIYYKIPIKKKYFALAVIFSLACLLLAIFCFVKYSYNLKAQKLIGICIAAALVHWPFLLFGKKITNKIKFQYEKRKTLPVFFLSLFLLWFLFGLFIPSQLIVSAPQEFAFIDDYSNPLFFLYNTASQAFGLFIFWPACLFFLFSPEIKKYFSLCLFTLTIAMIVNVFAFSGDYGIISIGFVYNKFVSHSSREILINLAVLVPLIIAAVFIYMQKFKNTISALLCLCLFSLFVLSSVNIIKIGREFGRLKLYYTGKQEEIADVAPVFSFSRTGKNVALIMLDRAASVFIPSIFDEMPELKEKYSGFTFYPNTVSFDGYTRIGSPPVFGGYEYTPEEINKRNTIPLVQKHNEALLMLPRIFSKNGFSVCVTDPPYANYNWISDLSIFDGYKDVQAHITDAKYTDRWIQEHDLKLPQLGDVVKRNMLWYSLLKGLPFFLRQAVYLDGTWFSPIGANKLRLTLNGYAVLDYLPRLIEISDDVKDAALIMTNNTTHENSFLQAPEYRPAVTVTNFGSSRFSKEAAYHVNAASIQRLAEWFDLLKKENIYDSTKIIIVSDHGPEANFVTKASLPFNVDQFNPLLMVKDFNARGEMKTDMGFMSNADAPSMALQGIIDKPVNPFTGTPVSTERKKEPLYIAISGTIHLSGRIATQFDLNPNIDYLVHDNIFEAKNWIPAAAKK
jgi:YidC/Oxa1 family membrane protein insertase